MLLCLNFPDSHSAPFLILLQYCLPVEPSDQGRVSLGLPSPLCSLSWILSKCKQRPPTSPLLVYEAPSVSDTVLLCTLAAARDKGCILVHIAPTVLPEEASECVITHHSKPDEKMDPEEDLEVRSGLCRKWLC